jgi:transcription initiation factor TFIIIB Brf1 subunit/transcription initiation factor TFIIB
MSNNDIWNMCVNLEKSFTEDDNPKDDNSTDDKKTINENNENNEQKCNQCSSQNFVLINNEKMVCDNCGAIGDIIIDYSQEWRYYGSNDNKRSSDPNRCGMPSNPLFDKPSLSTIILGKGFDKLRKLNSWNGITYKERRLIEILNMISEKAKTGKIPQCVVDKAIVLFKNVSDNQIKRGQSLTSIIAACLRLAIKYHSIQDIDVTRSINELAKLFNLDEKKFKEGYNESFEIMFKKDREFIKKIKPTTSTDLIARFCAFLNINNEYKQICINVSGKINKLGICQKNNPKSIAVGVIYLISQIYRLGLTKTLISNKCETSEVTITNTYMEMYRFRQFLL